MQRIKDANLTVKLAKCQFGMKERVHVGLVGGTVRTETNKIEAVESFPRPETKREVRGFFGLTGYGSYGILPSIYSGLSDVSLETSI